MDAAALEKIGISMKLLVVPKESTRRTFMDPGFIKGVEHNALVTESIVAVDEKPLEKTQRIPNDEGNLDTSAKTRTCEVGKYKISGETDTSESWLPCELDTKVAFDANDWCEHGMGPGQTRTKQDWVI